MTRQILCFAAGIFLQFVFTASIAAQDRAVEATICSITAEPERYVNKYIEVDAIMYVGFEAGWLKDRNDCESPSNFRFDHRYGKEYEQRTSSKVLRQIDKILSRRIVEPTDINKYRGRFSMRLLQYEKRNQFDTRFDYVVEILKVESVEEAKSTRSPK